MDPKSRFSSRVDNYVQYRPGYPAEIIETLRAACGLTANSRVADIGSGTGLLAVRFLEAGCPVVGVEPNAEMRAAGEKLLAGSPNFTSLDGSAEATGLPAASVDFVTAGQAFHWFDRAKTGAEFRRILKPGGWAVLVWNERRLTSTPFLRAYEEVLQTYATDYVQVNHRNVEDDEAALETFFGGPYQVTRYDNHQTFDLAGIQGRALSSSYVPEAGHPDHPALLAALRRVFDQHQQGGRVAVEYDTRMFHGRLMR